MKWNYGFWLNSKKSYKTITIKQKLDEFDIDQAGKMHYKYKTINKKRFMGYFYKGIIYWDNPGFKIEDREEWLQWKRKGLIKE